jgi:hypothetical protein
VAAAIVAVTLGGRVAATAVRDAAGASVGIAGVATVDPPRGWTEDPTLRDDDPTRFVLTKGSAVVAVTVLPESGVDLPTLMASYERRVLDPRLLDLATTDPVPAGVGGLPGLRLIYVGRAANRAQVEGVVMATVGPSGAGLVIDATAPESVLATVAEDVAAMAAGASVT